MYHFILNPASRSGIAEKIWSQTIEPYLTNHEVDFRVHFSQSVGDITSLVREISETATNTQRVIVLGGDGTLNEALQGITDFSKIHLGFIPIGSSNDVTRDMDISLKPIQALEHILQVQEPKLLDYGKVTYEDGSYQNFMVSLGIGFDAAICEEANRSVLKKVFNKLGIGKLIYLGIALKQLYKARSISATLEIPGAEPRHIQKLLFLAAMNHKFEGGGFMFGPDAEYTDGILNLCEVGDIPKLKILFALPTAYKGNHFKYDGITAHQTASFTLTTSEPMWVHVDGEVAHKEDKITVSCHRQELQFLL